MSIPLGVYKLREDAKLPYYATKQSACFDIPLHFDKIKVFGGNMEEPTSIPITNSFQDAWVPPKQTVVFGTGLVFDIPEGYKLVLQVRSSTGIKRNLMLSNIEGIIDSDYTDELKIALYNRNSYISCHISQGDVLVQGSIEKVIQADIFESYKKVTQKTDRVGGIGSTDQTSSYNRDLEGVK